MRKPSLYVLEPVRGQALTPETGRKKNLKSQSMHSVADVLGGQGECRHPYHNGLLLSSPAS